MWTCRNFDELKTFPEWKEANPEAQLYNGTPLEGDAATQEALEDWFYYRKVVDNARFERFYRRALNLYGAQFYALLRVQTTELDPLVSNYLERQILRKGARSESGTERSTAEGTTNTRSTNRGTGGGTTTTTTEGTATGNGSSNASTTEQGTTTGTSNTDARSKHGETPQAAVGGGMNLDWTYLSSQDQTQTDNTTSGTTNGTTTTTGSTTDSSRTTGTSSTTTSDTSTAEGTVAGSDSKTTSGSSSKSENTNDDTRERLTGRQEAPQDLLARARDYIATTNAFAWLCGVLDYCFMGVLEW